MSINIYKYAAIDIGSNAIRLLVASVITKINQPPVIKKTSLVRVPIRLGQDVFTTGSIGEVNKNRMLDSMRSYALLMSVHQVEHYKAYATSAMRDAQNGLQIARQIKQDTGIDIEIIDGNHEAAIIATTDLHTMIDDDKVYLYVDVGGGSTEFTLYSQGKQQASQSFKIGTVRLLNNLVTDNTWQQAQQWVESVCAAYQNVDLIGSGGNINNIFKSSDLQRGKPLTYIYLADYFDKLKSYTYPERIYHLGLNQDRADVIIPACRIYLSAMKWSKAQHIYVPKIGLADGIIKSIYNELMT